MWGTRISGRRRLEIWEKRGRGGRGQGHLGVEREDQNENKQGRKIEG
jgi:hypothetical protein